MVIELLSSALSKLCSFDSNEVRNIDHKVRDSLKFSHSDCQKPPNSLSDLWRLTKTQINLQRLMETHGGSWRLMEAHEG